MNELTKEIIEAMNDDGIKTELARRYHLVNPNEINLTREELVIALTTLEEVA